MKSILTFTIITAIGFFAIRQFIPAEEPVTQTTCTIELDTTEQRIFQVSADIDTIGQIIDSMEAKLDSLLIYKEMN